MSAMDQRSKKSAQNHSANQPVFVSKIYADVLSELGPDWSDLDNFEVNLLPIEKFEIGRWIGTGKYSDVFLGFYGDQQVALKILKPVMKSKYLREIKICTNLRKGPNIIHLLAVTQNSLTKQMTLIFEYFEASDFNLIYESFTENETKICFYQLLRALQFAHSHGIMHRDIKPQKYSL